MSSSNDDSNSNTSSIRRIVMFGVGISGLFALVTYGAQYDMESMMLENAFSEVTIPEVTAEEEAMVEDEEFYRRMLSVGLSGPTEVEARSHVYAPAANLYERSRSSSTQITNEAQGNTAMAWRSGRSSPLSAPTTRKKHIEQSKVAEKETKNLKLKDGDRKRGLRGVKQETVSNVEDGRPLLVEPHRRLTVNVNGAERTSIEMMDELKTISSRFYIYEDPVISQTKIVEDLRAQGESAFAKTIKSIDHVRTDADSEKTILETLERHPLRTMNPAEAEIFVIPTPISELLAYGCQWENCTWYDDAFAALQKEPTFQKMQGHKHVLVALSWPLFSKRWSAFIPALSQNYHKLENITVAHNYDPFGCVELREAKKNLKVNDFKKIYDKETPMTNAFSLGLGFNDPFPVVKPSYDKFEKSKNFIFYHSRTNNMAYGSTPYRFAPLDNKVIEKLPPSSIGFDIPKEQWAGDMTSSKFCLVIRSDTPHSHSLLYALRAGCIPVIVSDDYTLYAPTLKSSMALEDFGIFIKEEDFIANPTRELLKLQDIPKEVIESKLESMHVAQTLAVPTHPQSLFVPALLKEVLESENNVFPEKPNVRVHEDYAILSGWEFMYRYPSTLPDASAYSASSDKPVVITGVISKSHHTDARHTIRGTWADERPGKVFFVVSGKWEDIEEEFVQHGDLLWLNMAEDVSLTTNKVQLLLHAVNAHVDSYDYLMKTADDSYVWLDDVELHLSTSKPDYWGTCRTQKTFTKELTGSEGRRYAHGMGYVLSREFNECATSYIETSGLMDAHEEIATGELAELCGVSCQENGWDWWSDPSGNKLDFVTSDIKSAAPMIFKHWYVMWRRGGWQP